MLPFIRQRVESQSTSKSILRWDSPQTWFQFLIIILLALGIFFRFVNLDRKVYWDDEATNSLRTSGYTETELFQQVYDGRVISIQDLQKYQYPSSDKGVIDTIKSLAIEEPQSPPLYYILGRIWMQWFGHSPVVMRRLSVLMSLLAFPCMYWLCLELFESPLVGWVAIALLAVSPFHVLYAQEARLYSFWTVTILLMSAALLRAMRTRTTFSWGTYAATVALGLYTFPFSGLVAVGHGLYVVVTEGFRLSKTLIAYLVASIAGLLAYTPWLFFIFTNSHKMGKWRTINKSLLELIEKWALNISHIFIDFNLEHPYWAFLILIPVGYSIYFLIRQTPKRVWLFVLLLIGVTALTLALPDLISGGQRSTIDRYLIPSYLGIELAVAFLLATQITSISLKSSQQKVWQLVAIAIFSLGVLSCVTLSQAETWWNKGPAVIYLRVAPIINQATHPLLISDGDKQIEGREIALSYLLKSKVQFLLVDKSNIPKLQIPDNFSDVFVFDPSKDLKEKIQQAQEHKLVPAYQGSTKVWLWRVEK